MLIQSAQTLTFSNTAEEKTAVLKSTKMYSALRISFEHVVTATGEATAGPILDRLDTLIVDVPEYGTRSRRIDLSGATIYTLPMLCQLGALGSADAASATSCNGTTGADSATGQAYFDIPVNKLNLDEDTRITIKASSSGAANTLNVSFAFLDTPYRNVYFKCYHHAAAATSIQQWFPSDGLLIGNIVAGSDGSEAVSSIYNDRNADNISQISLDGEQATTFSKPELLGAGLDEVLSGGAQGEYFGIDTYSMLKNFPTAAGARYVQVDRAESTALLIVGVMTDA